MNFLVTLIGNAAVDPNFRKWFLDDPVQTAEVYGFRFTKGDFQMMEAVFVGLTPAEKTEMEAAFKNLQDKLYAKIEAKVEFYMASALERIQPCHPPCAWSIYPPPELSEGLETAGKAKQQNKQEKTAA